MDRPTLISSLTLMTDDYATIQDQLARELVMMLLVMMMPQNAMFNQEIHQRLQEGINLLADESQPEAQRLFVLPIGQWRNSG